MEPSWSLGCCGCDGDLLENCMCIYIYINLSICSYRYALIYIIYYWTQIISTCILYIQYIQLYIYRYSYYSIQIQIQLLWTQPTRETNQWNAGHGGPAIFFIDLASKKTSKHVLFLWCFFLKPINIWVNDNTSLT